MPSCAVGLCSNNHYSRTIQVNLSFHRFPKDVLIAKKWVNVCKRKDQINLKNAVVCSVHFSEDDYEEDRVHLMLNLKERKLLKKDAVPSLFLSFQFNKLLNKAEKLMNSRARRCKLRESLKIKPIEERGGFLSAEQINITDSNRKVEHVAEPELKVEFHSERKSNDHDHFVSSSCGNCCTEISRQSATATFKFNREVVQILDTVLNVLGISWTEFRTWSAKYPDFGIDINCEETFKFCKLCSQLLLNIYKASKEFEKATHISSVVERIKGYKYLERENDEFKSESNETRDENDFQGSDYTKEQEESTELLLQHLNPENNLVSSLVKIEPGFIEQESTVQRVAETDATELKDSDEIFEEQEDIKHILLPCNPIPKTNNGKHKKTVILGQQCKMCDKILYNRWYYEHKHLPSHNKDINKACKICGQLSGTQKLLKVHMKEVHREKIKKIYKEMKVACKTCGKLISKSRLAVHEKYLHFERGCFKCSSCSKTFVREKGLNEHITIHSKDFTPYLCDQCGKSFDSKQKLTHHEKFHLPKKFFCDICPKTFFTSSHLKTHRQCHSTERKYMCDECGKTFKFKAHYSLHVKMHKEIAEKGEMSSQCPDCGKFLRHSLSLTKHKGRCQGRKRNIIVNRKHIRKPSEDFTPYLCGHGQCGKTFDSKQKLTQHEKLHSGRNYNCDICSKMFSTSAYLKIHKQCHSTERKYMCDECGKTFKFKAHYSLHVKMHKEIAEKGEMSSQCPDCGKFLRHSLSLLKHKGRCHGRSIDHQKSKQK